MDSQVRNYVISLAKNLLTSGDDVGEFIIEGWGGEVMSTVNPVKRQMRLSGFYFIENCYFAVMSIKGQKSFFVDSDVYTYVKPKVLTLLRMMGVNCYSKFIRGIYCRQTNNDFENVLSLLEESKDVQAPDEQMFNFINKAH